MGWLALGVACLGFMAGEVVESSADEANWGYGLAHELMSPFCPGRTLSACSSPQAAELRQWILLQEAAGASRDEVVSQLEARFGPAIRSSPEPEGWGLAAWMLPAVAAILGAALLAWALRRMVARPKEAQVVGGVSTPPPLQPAASDEFERLVDEELRAHDS